MLLKGPFSRPSNNVKKNCDFVIFPIFIFIFYFLFFIYTDLLLFAEVGDGTSTEARLGEHPHMCTLYRHGNKAGFNIVHNRVECF